MSISGLGSQVVVGLGHQTVYGTAVAATKFPVGVLSIDAKPVDPVNPSKAFRSRTSRAQFRGPKHTECELAVEANYVGDELLLHHLFGAVATTHPGTLAYQHVFTLANAALVGMSIEAKKDLVSYVYDSMKVAKATYAFSPGEGIIRKSFTLMGREMATVSAASATYPAFQPVLFDHVVLKKDAGSALEWESGEVTIDNGLLNDRPQMGSRYMLEAGGGRRSITGKIVIYCTDDTWGTIFRAGTAFKLNFLATAGANSIESTKAFTDDLELPVCYITALSEPVSDSGYIKQTVEFMGIYDITNAADGAKETLLTTTVTVP